MYDTPDESHSGLTHDFYYVVIDGSPVVITSNTVTH